MPSHYSNKKGNFTLDIIVFLVFFFILAIGGVVMKTVVSELNVATQAVNVSSTANEVVASIDSGYVNFMDGAYLVIMVLLILTLWFSVYLIDSHPFFFIITLFVLIIFTFISMLLSNVYFDLMSSDGLASTASQFTIIPFIWDNIVPIMVFVTIITGVFLYAKLRGGANAEV